MEEAAILESGVLAWEINQKGPRIPSRAGLGLHLCHTRVLNSPLLHPGSWCRHPRDLAAEEGAEALRKPPSRVRHKQLLAPLPEIALPSLPRPRAVTVLLPAHV